MKEWLGHWYNKYAVCMLCAAGGLGCYNGICWRNLSPSDWAAWVGALGTVSAFFAAVAVARWQLSWEHKKARREDEAKLQALLALAYDYAFQVTVSTMRLQRPAPGVISYPPPSSLALNYADIERGVEAIPLHQLPIPEYVPLMLLFRRFVRTTADDLDICKERLKPQITETAYEYIEADIHQIRERPRFIIAELRAAIRQFGCCPHEPPQHLTDIKTDWRGVLYDVP